MNFLRLPDILLSVLYEDDDILAIDKPYGLNAHTNDSKIEHSDFIQDGLIEIYEKQFMRKLHIIHRLDQTTTGVMIFGKSAEASKKYAEYFFNRQVKKTYWFITKNKSEKKSYVINQQIIHKAKELDALTDLNFLRESKNFQLWEALPHTGRNHQIRIHAKAAGIPILGDIKYEGHNYSFLCLHNCRIEFPNGLIIISKPPVYFEDLSILDDVVLSKAYFQADRRQRLFSNANSDQCFRLSHSETDFTIDQFGQKIVLTWNKERWTETDLNRFTAFTKKLNKELIIHNVHSETKTHNWVANEGNIQFHLQVDQSQFNSLLLNQRLQRNWILNNSENKNILNLFSQSSSVSVMASAGKALQITTVDSSKKFLELAKKNFELNQLNPANCKFLLRDSITFLEQCKIKNMTYDLIICEPPTFFRREKGVFKIDTDINELIKNCLQCLTEHGQLLFSTSTDKLSINDIQKVFLETQKDLNIQLELNSLLPSLDFELPDEKVILKSFIVRKIKK